MKVSNRWIASAQDAVDGDRVTTAPSVHMSVHIGSLGSHHRVHIDTRPCAWLSLVDGSLDIGSWLAHCGITRTTTGDLHSFCICGLACSPHRSRPSPQSWALFTLLLRVTSDLGRDSLHIGCTIWPSSAYGSLLIGPRLGPHRTEDSVNGSVPHLVTTQKGGTLDWMVVVWSGSTSA